MIRSATTKLGVEKIDHTVLLTIDNPPANTWDADNLGALKDVVEQCNADRDVYAIVITGRGEKFFSAGADLKLFASGDKGVAASMSIAFGGAFETLAKFRGVSIAAINGFAMGGGLECALACDIRIAEAHAVMALPEATVGLLPCGGGTQNLSWVVGEGWAKRMILCGERMNAEQALRIGLVEEVAQKGQARNEALKLAAMVAHQSPTSVTTCKELIQRGRSGDIESAYAAEREGFVKLFDSEDQKEGVTAFLEKRKPAWKNR